MSDVNQNLSKEGLANLAIDPDLLARELAAQLAGDPLDEIELDKTDEDLVNSSKAVSYTHLTLPTILRV